MIIAIFSVHVYLWWLFSWCLSVQEASLCKHWYFVDLLIIILGWFTKGQKSFLKLPKSNTPFTISIVTVTSCDLGGKKLKSEYQNHDVWGDIKKICFCPVVIICGSEPVCLMAEYMSNRLLIPAAMWGYIFFHQDQSNTDYQLSDTSFMNKELDPPVITFTMTSMRPFSGPKFGLELHF